MDLVGDASAHSSEAIRCDSLGAAGLAIHHYREAICALRMLLISHPDTSLRYSYGARCDSYRHRIDILERRMARGRTQT